jgi:hypothetical protein
MPTPMVGSNSSMKIRMIAESVILNVALPKNVHAPRNDAHVPVVRSAAPANMAIVLLAAGCL